jgi:Peptidase family M28
MRDMLSRLEVPLKHGRILAFLICFAAVAGAQQSSITPESLRTWLTYLASDELEGRATFSEGLGLAAAYIADQLKEAGVKPGGDHGSYFQRVEVLGIKSTNRSTVTVDVNGEKRTFKDGEGIRFPANVGGKRVLTFNEVEFVGYGLNIDDDHNDYKGLDVKDKVVVWLGAQGPKGTDPREAGRLLRGRASYATEEMGARAAIAPPVQPFPDGQRDGGRGGAPTAPAAPQGGRGGIVQPDFTTTQRLDALITPTITSTDEFLDFLFSGSDVKYADLKARAQQQQDLPKFTLKGVTITFDLDADYQVVNTRYTRNVVGIVEGNDARLKDTYVAFGAHYDHIGYSQGVLRNGQTDRISNGADDDGSGTVTLIGLARAFARGPKTRRSEIFVWHAGEELGLYGSRYFADHPTVPIDHIVAQLNMDMVGRNHDNLESESNTVYTVGADRISTELHNIMIDANASLAKPMTINFELNDPTDPERVYYRSDHYSYASKGISIIFFTTNLHPDYHRVTDEVDKILFDKMAHVAQFIYEIGRRVANLDHAPVRDFKGPRVGKGGQGKILTSN